MRTKCMISLLMLLTFPILLFSQQDYYYYTGEKMVLERNIEKASVILPKSITENMGNWTANYSDVEIVFDNNYDIRVLKLTTDVSTPEMVKESLPETIASDAVVLPVYRNSQFDELILTNYLYVKLKADGDFDLLRSVAENYDLEIVGTDEYTPLWYTLSVTKETGKSTLNVANEIFETGFFASAFPAFSFNALENCISDPDFSKQWGLYNAENPGIDISACSAWNLSKGKGVNIAIVDHGIDRAHTDLSANIHSLSYDTESRTSPSSVYGSHGTHCAGIAAAAINGRMVAGVAPEAKLMSVSNRLVFYANLTMDLAAGINWAWRNGADVISCSWNSPENDVIKEAIDNALTQGRNGKGTIVVKSAGNQYGGPVTFPGNYRSEMLTVSSINTNGLLSNFSSVGNEVDVCAPGGSIYSTIPNNGLDYSSGTSMACPHVAGVAALVIGVNQELTGQEVRDIIESNTKKIGNINYENQTGRTNGTWNSSYGYGLVDAYAAIQAAACFTTDFSNHVVTADTMVEGCIINVQNVNVQSGAKLTLDAREMTTINGPFEVKPGAGLEVK